MTNRQRRALVALATLLLFGSVLGLRGAWDAQGPRYLLIHCDDAGMCEAANLAVIDAFERGSVSSASIMVPCPGFDAFAAYATAHPEYDYGIHLTLTSELNDFRWGPVLPIAQVPSLVKPDGKFWNEAEDVAEHATLEDVEEELRAQIDLAKEKGIPLSHLDHHMFVMFKRPDLLKLYVRLGREYNLPIRIERTASADVDKSNPELTRTYYAALENLFSRGEPVLELSEINNYNVRADQKRSYFLNVLRNLRPGISEVIVHCAYDLPTPQHVPSPDRRAADTRVFTSPEIAREIDRLGIHVIDWKTCRAMAKQATQVATR